MLWFVVCEIWISVKARVDRIVGGDGAAKSKRVVVCVVCVLIWNVWFW